MEEICANLVHPQPKKSPTGVSTDGSASPSQYTRRIQKRQVPVGTIHICWIAPGPWMSASVKVLLALTIADGETFHPCPSPRAAFSPVPFVAIPPLPFSPVGFSA